MVIPPNDALQRIEKRPLVPRLSRLRNVTSDNLLEATEWCMALDPWRGCRRVCAAENWPVRPSGATPSSPSAAAEAATEPPRGQSQGFDRCALVTLKLAWRGSSCREILMRFQRLPGQPPWQPPDQRGPDGLLLHQRSRPLCPCRWHGGISGDEVAAQIAADPGRARSSRTRPVLEDPTPSFCGCHRRCAMPTKQGPPPTACVLAQPGFGGRTGTPRLYMVREGSLIARTRDHSTELQEAWVAAMGVEGFNRNVLFTCLGSPGRPMVDCQGPILLEAGDRILLCSDDLWGNVEGQRADADHRHDVISEAVAEMVEVAARWRAATNVTAPWSGERGRARRDTTQALLNSGYASTIPRRPGSEVWPRWTTKIDRSVGRDQRKKRPVRSRQPAELKAPDEHLHAQRPMRRTPASRPHHSQHTIHAEGSVAG